MTLFWYIKLFQFSSVYLIPLHLITFIYLVYFDQLLKSNYMHNTITFVLLFNSRMISSIIVVFLTELH